MKPDLSEKGLESLIVSAMAGTPIATGAEGFGSREDRPAYGGNGWKAGNLLNYNREYAVDLVELRAFLESTQPDVAEVLDLAHDSITRKKFLARLQGEITRRGVIDVLRKGVQHVPVELNMFYGTPTQGNSKAEELYRLNRFTVTRQLQYSADETRRALDVCLFINGLPVITFELKNNITAQTYVDAIEQYRRDRDPRELIFMHGRCMVHFAVDDSQAWMCTNLKGKASWFLPFNKGWNDGAGNPPLDKGVKTEYLWKEVLAPDSLTDIIENYAQMIEWKDERTHQKKQEQIFPRYHQLDVVRKTLADAARSGAGKRYLIQHSAGSGKSNSIAWLAHQLIALRKDGKPTFDSIIVVTDRVILDSQIKDTIKQYAQVSSIIGHAEHSGDLRKFLDSGKKIIITTVQKFPFVLDDISSEHSKRHFAIIIDEAHSSQGGRNSAAMSAVLKMAGSEEDNESVEDEINDLMEKKKMLTNASYFAFTATPKNRTLEMFGIPFPEGDKVKHRPFHSYTMKQAIQEGFILDVLANYTPVLSYYKLIKKVEGDPEFETRRAYKKLRQYVENNNYAIQVKAEIIVDHFVEQVINQGKLGGQARAMVVTSGVDRAIQYYFAIQDALKDRKSAYRAIIAFSGEHEVNGINETEASLNKFASNMIADMIQTDPYRFLICADKFQTGYDEPLLHSMYVDKTLEGIKAVQTLSRLNRAHPQKHDTFVMDFANDPDMIKAAFDDYYRTTILSDETDPNKLHDLKATLDGFQIYSDEQIDQFVGLYLNGANQDRLFPILDACVAVYRSELDENGQVTFKGKSKAFLRAYNFLGSILPYKNARWEKLSIFLSFLVPKLPAPQDDDLSKGILEAVDIDSYRAEKQQTISLILADNDAEIDPLVADSGGAIPDKQLDRLSNIIKAFNDQFGNINWTDTDRVQRLITEEIPRRVAADILYQNAKLNSDRQNARIEHDKALGRVMTSILQDDSELFKQFSDNQAFRRWMTDKVFEMTYE
jgi:type I restriction enzyme, R subunit